MESDQDQNNPLRISKTGLGWALRAAIMTTLVLSVVHSGGPGLEVWACLCFLLMGPLGGSQVLGSLAPT